MKLIQRQILLMVLALFIGAPLFSQSFTPDKIIKPVGFAKIEKLSDLKPVEPGYRDRTWKEGVVPNKTGFLEEFQQASGWYGPDPVLQDEISANRSGGTVGQNWTGIPNLAGVAPPDTDGDVGPNHYMQMVNMSFQIWDKSGNSLYGPADNITLWQNLNGPWSGTNDGDPIVLYDEYADRWIASQFSLPNYPQGPFYELIAVSETGDPTGAWYQWAYEFSNMPDYPKFGVWPDAYYFTINQFAPPQLGFAGGGICAVDRTAMLNGDPNASIQFFNLGTSYGSLLPADADGVGPDSGTPNYLASLTASSVLIFQANIDWNNSSNSTIDLIENLAVNNFSYSNISVDQPGTSQTLDAMSTRLMYRLQYRNFGSYEVMLTNHSVNADGNGNAGVRWYEFRNEGSGWYIYQQGTFAPADGDNRWMGSVAMNGNGDIAIGYSVSGPSTYPSIRFAGQSASNSGSGVLDIDETSIYEGSNSQTGVDRWGDYSMMSVDPTDDQTFWYTTEFSNGGWSWGTQVASFTFAPPVVIAPIADFSGNPTSINEGQSVSFTDLSQNNPTSWSWSFPGGTPSTSTLQNPVVTYASEGTYDVTLISTNSAGSDTKIKTGYITVSVSNVSYCTSSGADASGEWIETINLGTFTNNSGTDGGYGDYTGMNIMAESGQVYDYSLIPGYPGRADRENWRVWIDFNFDGDYEDAGEQVIAFNNKKGAVSGTISIPAGISGTTGMRVSMEYGGIPSPCDHFAYGEVEDYTMVITLPGPQPPIANFEGSPTSVSVGNAVQFTDLSSNDPTSWSWTFDGGSPGTSSDQHPLITYDVEGTYAVSLTVTNAYGSDTKTVDGYITVSEGGTTEYCTSASLSNALDYISLVEIATFSHSSGASLYSDFTAYTINLAPGSNASVTLTPTFTGKTQREFWRIWIDFNQDGDFEDADEQVFVANNQRDVVSGSISIPSYASGQTRMRVTMKNSGAPSPCETFANGEVEDYTVVFSSAPAKTITFSDIKMELFPNPAGNELNIRLDNNREKATIRIYNALGRIVHEFNMTDPQIKLDLGGYTPGIYYVGADNGEMNTLKKFIKK